MPTRVQLESGRIVEFDQPPTPEDIDSVVAQLGTQSSTPTRERFSVEKSAQTIKAMGVKPPFVHPIAFAFSPQGEALGRDITEFGQRAGRRVGDIVESVQNLIAEPPRPRVSATGIYPRVTRPSDFEIGARSTLPAIPEAIGEVGASFATPKSLVMGALAGPALKGFAGTRFANAPIRVPFTRRPLNEVINIGITKGIRPSVAGKATAGQTERYYGQARQAVQAIAENEANLQFVDEVGRPVRKLPESLKEFSSAIEQTKERVFQQYDSLTKQAGQQGVTVRLSPIADEVVKGVASKEIKTLYPEVEQYALAKAEALKSAGSFTPEEAQNAIKMLNKSLEAYYKNPTPETASRAVIDAGIANNLRKSLDQGIDDATGRAYQPLKRTYGALKAIEKDVARRALIHGRQNAKGLIDFTDIFSGGHIARGILTLNPAEFATGVAQKGIAAYIKNINNPDRIVQKMFQQVKRASQSPTR